MLTSWSAFTKHVLTVQLSIYIGGVKVLTDAGSVIAVVSLRTVGDAVIAKQPGPRHFTPETHTADARLEVCRAALTV